MVAEWMTRDGHPDRGVQVSSLERSRSVGLGIRAALVGFLFFSVRDYLIGWMASIQGS